MRIGERLVERGMQQGIQQGAFNVARRLLNKGIDLEIIAEATDLSQSEIIKLKKN